jgi:predicted nuclease of predicted toxin-antitoxin system
MRVLLDNNVNVRFRRLLSGHEIAHVLDLGWDKLQNGNLLRTAEENGFEVLVTADKNMSYQQNFRGRKISLVVLNSLFIKWDSIRPLASQVQAVLNTGLAQGSFVVIDPK